MSDWISLDGPELDTVAENADLGCFVSPFDTPLQVRSRFEEAEGRFVLEWAYAGREQPAITTTLGVFRFHLGERTQRLHRVEMDAARLRESTRALDMDAFEAVADALKALSSRRTEAGRPVHPRTANYQAVLRALELHREELLGTWLL